MYGSNQIKLLLRNHSISAKISPIFDCIPKYQPPTEYEVELLQNFVNKHKQILVVTGAGISTESGIPDYRSEGVGLYARSNHRPMQYQDFLNSAKGRQRYWARNYIGWPKFSQSQPSVTHEILRKWEVQNRVSSIITQNVDGLHTKAGSKNVIELHGTAYKVICLNCGEMYHRTDIQERLRETNPEMVVTVDMIRPDGDVDISEDQIKNFKPPICNCCQGILKPYIIFFGDNVPKERADKVRQNVTNSDGVLVLGSSLSTYSGYRIILQAVEENKEVAVVNIGSTRADHIVDLKIATRCGDILEKCATV